jgi:putative transcriptional regulator
VAGDPSNPNLPIQLQGQLLLADPSLRDGTFNRSVILLAEHQAEGAFGLILNHPTGKTVGDLLDGDDFAPLRQLAVHEGGPVARDQLTFSSFWWSRKQNRLRWSIRLSAEDAIAHAHKPGRIVRAFVGYSGWMAGQLENELRRSSWIAARPQPDLLGQEHDRGLWSELLRQLSPLHRILAEAPDDPSLN